VFYGGTELKRITLNRT